MRREHPDRLSIDGFFHGEVGRDIDAPVCTACGKKAVKYKGHYVKSNSNWGYEAVIYCETCPVKEGA